MNLARSAVRRACEKMGTQGDRPCPRSLAPRRPPRPHPSEAAQPLGRLLVLLVGDRPALALLAEALELLDDVVLRQAPRGLRAAAALHRVRVDPVLGGVRAHARDSESPPREAPRLRPEE